MPSRRRFLRTGSLAATLGLTGCFGRAATDDSPANSSTSFQTPPPERLTFGEAYDPADGDAVKATDARVQSSVRRLANVDHNAIKASAYWYLFITVDAMPAGPLPRHFHFRTADGKYDSLAVRDERLRERVEYVNGDAYRGASEATEGWLLFEVPYDDPLEDARLVLDGAATWTLPDATVQQLRADPPDFEVQAVEAPKRPPADEPFNVLVTVFNSGGAGTFRGAFNYTAPLYAPQGIIREIAPETEQSFAVEVNIHIQGSAEAGNEVAATLISPDKDHSWSVILS